MYSKKYILEKVEEFNGHNRIYDKIEGTICYLAYFKEGERGLFLHEYDDSILKTIRRVHTSIVQNTKAQGNYFIVQTSNTRFSFREVESDQEHYRELEIEE